MYVLKATTSQISNFIDFLSLSFLSLFLFPEQQKGKIQDSTQISQQLKNYKWKKKG